MTHPMKQATKTIELIVTDTRITFSPTKEKTEAATEACLLNREKIKFRGIDYQQKQ